MWVAHHLVSLSRLSSWSWFSLMPVEVVGIICVIVVAGHRCRYRCCSCGHGASHMCRWHLIVPWWLFVSQMMCDSGQWWQTVAMSTQSVQKIKHWNEKEHTCSPRPLFQPTKHPCKTNGCWQQCRRSKIKHVNAHIAWECNTTHQHMPAWHSHPERPRNEAHRLRWQQR